MKTIRERIFLANNYKWMVFAALGTGSLTNVIHHGSVSIALPTIAEEFKISLSLVQWIVLAESLTISSMLLPMGKLSDMIGRKPMYLFGCFFFAITSFLSGCAPFISTFLGLSKPIFIMIPFRISQGLAGAMIQANGMAMVTSVFLAKERGKGLGAHSSIIGTGGVIGPIFGGFLISYLSWHWIFWVNVPLCLITIFFCWIILDSSKFQGSNVSGVKFDGIGAVLSTLLFVSFLTTLSNGTTLGWTSLPIFVGASLFVGSVIAFIKWELRTENPLLDLTLFKQMPLSIGVGSHYASFLGVASFRFIIIFYLQAALKLNPAQVALILVPNAISRIIIGPISGYFSDQYGARPFTMFGLLLSGIGLFMLGFMNSETSITYLLTAILIYSFGSGIFMPANSASIFSVGNGKGQGVIAALVNLSRNS
jgi:EmrB/QacA subfamily drug resistance transporter